MNKEEEKGSDVKNAELPILRVKGSETGPKIAFERRMQIIDQYVKRLGMGNARTFTKKIAEKYNIGVRQVRKDFQWIKGNFKPQDIQQITLDLKILRDKTLDMALLNIQAANTPGERNDAIKSAWVVIEKYRQDLENWGEKDKVAEKMDVTTGTVINLIEKSVEEIKSEKPTSKPNQPNQSDNKPETNRDSQSTE